MKRLSLALATIGLSAGAFAALPAATDPTLVSVPQLPGGFVIGGSGYYLQPTPTDGDLDYATVSNSTHNTFNSSLKSVDPGYNWGWGVNVGYIFPNTGNDINLSYFQLNTSDTNSLSDPNVNPVGIKPVLVMMIDLPGFNYVGAKAEYDLDQVDLTAGQYIDVGCRLSLHPFAGLRWAQLDRKLTTNEVVSQSGSSTDAQGETTITGVVNASVVEKSDFSGIGPVVGLDSSYYVGMGFGVVGHANAALLVGNTDSNINLGVNILNTTTVTTAATVVTSTNSTIADNFSADDIRRVVPVLEGKLGVNYTYVFNNTANSDLSLEAGWMVANYFNAVDRLQLGINAGANGSPFIASRTTSDLGLQGPYVSLMARL